MKTFSKEVFMNKEAIAAKTLLSIIGGGAVLAGGGAATGHRFGVRAGAERMGNQMASAFSEANAKENKAIADSFKAFNKKENAVIANQFLRKGINVGYNMASTKPPTSVPMKKAASDIADEAFLDEMEKLGFPYAGIKAAGGMAAKALRRSFKAIGGKRGLISSIGRTAKTGYGAGKSLVTGKGVSKAVSGRLGQNIRGLGAATRRSGLALGTVGAGTIGVGAATRPKKTIVEHRY